MNWPWNRKEPGPEPEPEPEEKRTWKIHFKGREPIKIDGISWSRNGDFFAVQNGQHNIFVAHWDDIFYVEDVTIPPFRAPIRYRMERKYARG